MAAGTMGTIPSSSTKGTAMYVLLGSNGNVTSKAAALLLAQGAAVRVIGRNAKPLAAVRDKVQRSPQATSLTRIFSRRHSQAPRPSTR
jgi:hypothetical protein